MEGFILLLTLPPELRFWCRVSPCQLQLHSVSPWQQKFHHLTNHFALDVSMWTSGQPYARLLAEPRQIRVCCGEWHASSWWITIAHPIISLTLVLLWPHSLCSADTQKWTHGYRNIAPLFKVKGDKTVNKDAKPSLLGIFTTFGQIKS